MKHKQSILGLHFSYPTKFNTEEFFTVLENDIIQRTLEDIHYLSRICVEKSTIQKKIN